MKKKLLHILLLSAAWLAYQPQSSGQGIHFSQYYNAPMLLNPANTALHPEHDYRVGVNYRNQWASVPVPYKTISAFADFKAFSNLSESSWLGVGLAIFNDVAGDGNLKLTKPELFLAYHVQLGEFNMLSAGLSAGYAQRSVDFNKLTFDLQWDGFKFDGDLPSGEKGGVQKASFIDVGAGINYAFFPNENFYMKIGAGVAHVNMPTESFYGNENQLSMRPTGNIDVLLKANQSIIINPSVYYTYQAKASQLVYGSLFLVNVAGDNSTSTQLTFGGFHRWNEAIVGVLGVDIGGLRMMGSYDFTTSQLSTHNKGFGAMEFSVIFKGFYGSGARTNKTYNCPRF